MNVMRVMQGHTDTPLSNVGIEQVSSLMFDELIRKFQYTCYETFLLSGRKTWKAPSL